MVVRVFDYLRTHSLVRRASLAALTLVMAVLAWGLTYKEDITDFLPLDSEEREAMQVCQDISGANRLFILFDNPDDPDRTVEAISRFTGEVEANDTASLCKDLTATFDLEKLYAVTDYVYTNIPYFLTDADYQRMDSLLAEPQYVEQQLGSDCEMLMFPSGSLLSENISRDPLNLFTPVAMRLQGYQQESRFEMYDGYIFTPDMKHAIVMLSSPFGNAESGMNSRLIDLLESSLDSMRVDYPDIKAHVAGGPQIAFGNAHQIKYDSILAVSLAALLILSLLYYSFRSVRNMALIALSILWGSLFAIAGIALVHDSISIIVIGIASVIIGIAVNYPLHLIAHTDHQPNIREALKEIVTPLLVGNVTTVGAFLALVPLHSVAMRDLGLFASFLLVGTILFVLVYLPHIIKPKAKSSEMKGGFITYLANIHPEGNKWVVGIVLVLTMVFGYFSFSTEFDSNIANINYTTDQQRADLQYFEKLLSAPTKPLSTDADSSAAPLTTLYVVSSGKSFDEALTLAASKQAAIDSVDAKGLLASHVGVTDFLSSQAEQQRRIDRWNQFLKAHPDLQSSLTRAAEGYGFSPDAFDDFSAILQAQYAPRPFEYFAPLTSLVFSGNISHDVPTGRCSIVDVLKVQKADIPTVTGSLPGCFDVASLNSKLADSLSNDFNYIGWACSLIVFFFLWFSFRRIELAIISFLPMAISWVWILGIMSLLGIKFNIVNIILATFIFGQGDDYTIFMTEGCISEYVHKKPVLASYKNSIILSALIMFIGIGTLILAKHPAMHSLAELTIVGMFSVVLMAYIIPPLLFKWMMKRFPKRFENL